MFLIGINYQTKHQQRRPHAFFSHSGMSRDAFQRSHYSIKGLTAKTDSIKIGGQIEAMVGIISRINLIKRRVAGVLY